MNAIIFGAIVLAILAFSIVMTVKCSPHGNVPPVKTQDVIAEEIRAERIALHNTSLQYAELQRKWIQDDVPTPLNANRLEGLLATAFREGAKWQQRRP